MKKQLFLFMLAFLFVGMAWAQTVELLNNTCATEMDGWILNNGGNQAVFQTATGGYYLVDHADDYVQSPAIDIEGYQNFSLSLSVATYGNGTNNPAFVQYSLDGGTTWEDDTFTTATPTSTNYISSGIWAMTNVTGNSLTLRFSCQNPPKGVRMKNILLKADPAGVATPVLDVVPDAIANLNYEENHGPSDPQSIALTAVNLVEGIQVVASEGFEVSLAEAGDYSAILNIPQGDGSVSTTVYVRLESGLAVGAYSGTATFNSDSAEGKTVNLSGSVSAEVGEGGYYVDFEDGNKISYSSATVNLNGLDWNMTEALVGSDPADWKNGLKSARLRGYATSVMTMLEDKPNGLGTLSFYYRRYGTDAQMTWRVEYSTDQGENWTQIGNDFTAPASNDVQQFIETVNATGNVRIKISCVNGASQNKRLNIDDIHLSDFTGGAPVAATPVFDPPAGFYLTPQTVSISSTSDGVNIRYTTDGSNPSETAGTLYSTPINITGTTTLKAIAYGDGYITSAVNTGIYSFPIEVANIAELRSHSGDGTSVFKLTGEAVLTYQNANRNTKYIQDSTGAIVIDDQGGVITTEYDLYDGITGIYGKLNLYSGLLQFLPQLNTAAATSTGNVVVPEVRTLESLVPADQAKLIKVKNLSFNATGTFGAGAQNYNNVTDGTATLTLRTFPNTDYAGTPIPTEPVDLICLVGQFNAAMQIGHRFLADILPIVTELDAPVVTLSRSGNNVVLSWDAIAGATGYRILSCATSNGEYTLLTTVEGTSHSLPIDAQQKFFKVIAINE